MTEVRAWCVANPNGEMVIDTWMSTPARARGEFLIRDANSTIRGGDLVWSDYKKLGYKVVPVTITEVKDDQD